MAQKIIIDPISGKPLLTDTTTGSEYTYVKDLQPLIGASRVNGTTLGLGTGSIFAHIILPLNNIEVDEVSIRVVSGVVGNAVVSIYDVGNDGLPSELVAQTGEFDTNVTGRQVLPISTNLKAFKNYYVGFTCSANVPSMSVLDRETMIPIEASSTLGNAFVRIAGAFVYSAAMPPSFPGGAGTSSLPSAYSAFNLV